MVKIGIFLKYIFLILSFGVKAHTTLDLSSLKQSLLNQAQSQGILEDTLNQKMQEISQQISKESLGSLSKSLSENVNELSSSDLEELESQVSSVMQAHGIQEEDLQELHNQIQEVSQPLN